MFLYVSMDIYIGLLNANGLLSVLPMVEHCRRIFSLHAMNWERHVNKNIQYNTIQ